MTSVQSVELLLDDRSHAAVLAQWGALAEAGLPSQAHHRGDTNAPHITVGVVQRIDDDAEARLGQVAQRLPLPMRLGPLALFGGRRVVLVRIVVPTADLMDLHEATSAALADCPGQVDQLQPGRWVPHVTLARRMAPDSLSTAVQVLTETPSGLLDVEVEAVAMRRWDSVARRAWLLEP